MVKVAWGLIVLLEKLGGFGREVAEKLDQLDEEFASDPVNGLKKILTHPVNTGIRLNTSRKIRYI